jgi:hypothetical protein
MSTPDAFAVMLTSTLISVGIFSALSQMGAVLHLFGRHGFIIRETPEQDETFLYLSDTFVKDPGLANTWLIAMIPSLAVAAIVINTSIAREMKRIKQLPEENRVLRRVNWFYWICEWVLVWITHIGLMMLVLYNIVDQKGLHITGVSICMGGGLILNGWIILLDYRVHRRRWHPLIIFDTFLLCVALIAIVVFFTGTLNVSVTGEWILLVILMVIHALLPIRGARIVLSTDRPKRII